MADLKELILKNGDVISVKDETARNDIQTLSTNKLDKPTTNGTSGQALTIDSNGNVVWGNVSSNSVHYDNHNFNKSLPFNDLTEVFANEIQIYGNNPWTWLHARLSAGNLTSIHLGDYIKFSFAIGDGPLLEYTARIHTIYKNYYNRYVIDFWCDELLPNTVKWNNLLPQAQAQYYYNEGLQDNNITGHYVPYYCSSIYKYLNALSGYTCNSATFNSNTNTTMFTFAQEDFTQTGVWNYIPADLKTYITTKTGYGSTKKAITKDTYISHYNNVSTHYAYIYPSLTSINHGNLWLPISADFYIPNRVDISPQNPIVLLLNYHYASAGSYNVNTGPSTSAVVMNSGNVDPLLFMSYYNNRECLSKYYPQYMLFKDRNNPNTNVSFWLEDLGMQHWVRIGSTNISYKRVNASNEYSYTEHYVPLCFTIG